MHNTKVLNEIIAKADKPGDFLISPKATTRAIARAVVSEIEGGCYLPMRMQTVLDGVDVIVDVRDNVVPDNRFTVTVSAFPKSVSAFDNPRGDRFVMFAKADGFATV